MRGGPQKWGDQDFNQGGDHILKVLSNSEFGVLRGMRLNIYMQVYINEE